MSEALAAVFEDLTKRYKPGVIEESLTFYFSLGEDEGQKWSATLSPDSMVATPGKKDADVFVKMDEALFHKLLAGEWKPGMGDFLSGKIKSNDPFKLPLLKDCFDR